MGELPLSLNLDADVIENLEREARLQKVSPDDIAQRAIETYLDVQESERAIIRERIAEADKGVFIRKRPCIAGWKAGEPTMNCPLRNPIFFPPNRHEDRIPGFGAPRS